MVPCKLSKNVTASFFLLLLSHISLLSSILCVCVWEWAFRYLGVIPILGSVFGQACQAGTRSDCCVPGCFLCSLPPFSSIFFSIKSYSLYGWMSIYHICYYFPLVALVSCSCFWLPCLCGLSFLWFFLFFAYWFSFFHFF